MRNLNNESKQTYYIADRLRRYIYQSISVGSSDDSDLLLLSKLDYHEKRFENLLFPPENRCQLFLFGWHARAIRILNSHYVAKKNKARNAH